VRACFFSHRFPVVWSVEQPHTLPKSPCMQLRLGGRQVVRIATIGGLRLDPGFPCKHPQSRGCLYRGPTRPTVCFPCYRQRTSTHHTLIVSLPFFWVSLGLGVTPQYISHWCRFVAIAQTPELHGQCQPGKCVPAASGQSMPGLLYQSLSCADAKANCRPHSWHLKRCLPLSMRPFLTVREDVQMGQAGMSR